MDLISDVSAIRPVLVWGFKDAVGNAELVWMLLEVDLQLVLIPHTDDVGTQTTLLVNIIALGVELLAKLPSVVTGRPGTPDLLDKVGVGLHIVKANLDKVR